MFKPAKKVTLNSVQTSSFKMHILIIPSWYPETSQDVKGSFFREQALSLQKYGCKVGIISPQLYAVQKGFKIFTTKNKLQIEMDHGIPTYRCSADYYIYPSHYWVQLGLKLFKTYIQHHGMPDLIHAHSIFTAGILALKIKQKFRVRYVLTEHRTMYAKNEVRCYQRKSIQQVAREASRCFAVSTPFAKLMSSYTGKQTTWEVIPNIVHAKFLETEITAKSKNKFIFINICFLNKKKRIDILIKAFKMAFKNHPDVCLWIGGDGPERASLEALKQKIDLNHQISFLGMLNRDKVLKRLSEAHAFVLSSKYETFGVVLVEALGMGLPVVGTRCGGPEDIIHPNNGLLVEPDNIEALAKAMKQIYADKEKYPAEKLRDDCKSFFGEEVVTRKIIGHYQKILNQTRT
ncbi:MAG: glycosyltransferase [Candidatus Sericytochromatia bacterium]|nr:glycosyltransferase [Candidatus Sericytochromatia bacterium]